MSEDPPIRRPFVQEVDDAANPSVAPPVPDTAPEGRAVIVAGQIATARPSSLWRFALWAFGALFSFVLGVAAWDFTTALLARSPLLGWAAVVLLALAVLAALLLAIREWAAYARLARLDEFRQHADAAIAAGDLAQARRVVGNLSRLYALRPDAAWGRAQLAEREAEVMDADALLALAETTLLAPLDARALAEVEAAAARVAAVTALVPMALADVAAALFSNLRMIRRIAEVYGGRSGSLGSWRLLRRVFSSLVATGAVALTDDLIGSVAGGGLLSKLSRRFGEGVVNGALTVRIGISAIDQCRPLAFRAASRPGVTAVTGRALAGLISKAAKPSDPG